jgi:hypothetical protein
MDAYIARQYLKLSEDYSQEDLADSYLSEFFAIKSPLLQRILDTRLWKIKIMIAQRYQNSATALGLVIENTILPLPLTSVPTDFSEVQLSLSQAQLCLSRANSTEDLQHVHSQIIRINTAMYKLLCASGVPKRMKDNFHYPDLQVFFSAVHPNINIHHPEVECAMFFLETVNSPE